MRKNKFLYPLQCRDGQPALAERRLFVEFGIRNAEFGIILLRNFTAKRYFRRVGFYIRPMQIYEITAKFL